ncbi:MAG TPA: nitrile hydratase accessory protein [Acidimicrobiales bacterium]|nr:nitrile hydratase accessory protein [Acidimicrobiales bacterium]
MRDDVQSMEGAGAPPRSNGELVFDSPWQGRAFATAVGLVERLGLDWDAFRSRLIAAVSADADRPYYDSWVAALESLVTDTGLLDPVDVADRAAALET